MMNTRVRQAVLKILLLQEEFTQKELQEAAGYVSKNNIDVILSALGGRNSVKDTANGKRTPLVDGQSQVLAELKEEEPEKYKLLSKLDSSLRKGELVPKMATIKKVGASYSKKFTPGKSRKEAIPRLITLLSSMPIEQIHGAIEYIVSEAGGEGNEYADLANYLIYGERRKST